VYRNGPLLGSLVLAVAFHLLWLQNRIQQTEGQGHGLLEWREEQYRAAEPRRNIREEALREAGVLSQRQRTKELAQGKGYKAARRETTEEGTPRVRKEEGEWKHPGMTRRVQLWVEERWGRPRRDSADENAPRRRYWGRTTPLGNLVHSNKEGQRHRCYPERQ
jgi:hypothetical protein